MINPKLLTTNSKLSKCSAFGWYAVGVQLAPHTISGYNVCPHASTSADYPSNEKDCREYLELGGVVSVVFIGDLPTTWRGFPVIDGDLHDLTFLHGPGTVLGLSLKGSKPMSNGCADSCLYFTGRGRFQTVQGARIQRTRWLMERRASFVYQLHREIEAAKRKAKRLNLGCALRLNVLSDIPWETMPFEQVPQSHCDIQWYDYTKSTKRAFKSLRPSVGGWPNNYHLTLSLNHSVVA